MADRSRPWRKFCSPAALSWPLGFAWLGLVVFGFTRLNAYSHTAGAPALAKLTWPAQSFIKPNSTGSTLLVFVHPNCPCSVATIAELERLVVRTAGRTETHVFFFKPKVKSEAWAKELLWSRVTAIPTVTPHLDEDGMNAEIFGARTSGQIFFYDRMGNLIFRGGITPERGHMGDSPGRDAILTYLDEGRVPKPSSDVFGCSIRNPERAMALKGERE